MIKRFIVVFFSIGIMLLGLGLPEAQAKKDKTIDGMSARQIMKMVNEANMAKDQTSIVTMILIDKLGNEREIVTQRLHKHAHGHKGMDSMDVFFTQKPPSQRGTGFLILDYLAEEKADDLWLYLPSLKTSRRMTTRDQNDSFLGSDLTFADMGTRSLDQDDHKILSNTYCKSIKEPCYPIQSTPKEAGGAYSYKRFFISKKNNVAMRIEFFDGKKNLLKIQITTWQKAGKILVWEKSEIQNVQSKHKTIFKITEVKNNTGLDDSIFTERTLSKGGVRLP